MSDSTIYRRPTLHPLRSLLRGTAKAVLGAALAAAGPTLGMGTAYAGDNNPGTATILSPSITIPYEGFLMLDTEPMAGTRQLQFDLYDDPSAGSLVYSEQQTVTLYNGQFSASIGSGTVVSGDINTAVLDGDKLYLAIRIQSGNEWVALTGRQSIEAVPYSAWAGNSATMRIAGNLIVKGTTQLANNSISANELASNSVTAAAIATNAVGASEIASNAVGSAEIAANAVGASEIVANAIGTSELNIGAIFSPSVGETRTTHTSDNAGPRGGEVIATLSISAPTAGQVIALATCSVRCTNCSSAVSVSSGKITFSRSNSGDLRTNNNDLDYTTLYHPTFPIYETATLHDVFAVTAGTTTLYLRGGPSGDGIAHGYICSRINAIFIPTP